MHGRRRRGGGHRSLLCLVPGAVCRALVLAAAIGARSEFSRCRTFRERVTYAFFSLMTFTLAVLGSVPIARIWSIGRPHWAGLATGLAGIVVGAGLVWLVRIVASAAFTARRWGFGGVGLAWPWSVPSSAGRRR